MMTPTELEELLKRVENLCTKYDNEYYVVELKRAEAVALIQTIRDQQAELEKLNVKVRYGVEMEAHLQAEIERVRNERDELYDDLEEVKAKHRVY